MPEEGRGLSSRQTQDVVRDQEIGQPSNSEQCSEAADGVTRESEGEGRLSLLRSVRQDQPRRHSGACLCPVPLQQGRTRYRRPGFRGHREVVDADLADFFGSIPHTELMKSVARRVVDRRVLHLIKIWLECAVEETDDRGRKRRTTQARDNGCGIPQGSPLSPLLANRYMPPFVLGREYLG